MQKNLAVLLGIGLLLTACGVNGQTLPTALPNQLSKQTPGAGSQGYQVVLVQSVIVVGANRFAVGILDGGTFVKNANLNFTFYDLTQGSAKVAGTVPAVYREAPGGDAAMYTAQVSFTKAGSWGVGVVGTTTDGKPIDQKVGFDVVAKSSELPVGSKAPLVKSPTLTSVGGDLKKLTSAPKPNEAFYRLSVDEAVSSGKVTLVLFSTPAFCTSRLCGPDYEVIDQLYPVYADRVNFVHVEVYKDLPNPNLSKPQFADALLGWGLQTEPWTYIVKNGIVVWRAEGLITVDELKPVLDDLLTTP